MNVATLQKFCKIICRSTGAIRYKCNVLFIAVNLVVVDILVQRFSLMCMYIFTLYVKLICTQAKNRLVGKGVDCTKSNELMSRCNKVIFLIGLKLADGG